MDRICVCSGDVGTAVIYEKGCPVHGWHDDGTPIKERAFMMEHICVMCGNTFTSYWEDSAVCSRGCAVQRWFGMKTYKEREE